MDGIDLRTRRTLACLGDASRFQLVQSLLLDERCVSDLAHEVGLSQSCTTRHLQSLQREGLVCGTRSGKRVMFRLCLDQPRVRELLAWATGEMAADAAPEPSRAMFNAEGAARRRGSRRSQRRRRRSDASPNRKLRPGPARITAATVAAPLPAAGADRTTPAPTALGTQEHPMPAAQRPGDMEDWLL